MSGSAASNASPAADEVQLDPPASAPDDHAPDVLRGLGWSLLAVLFAAGFLIPYRLAVESAPRWTAMTAMFAAAAIFNGVVALAQHRRWRIDRDATGAIVVLALFTVTCNFGTARALPDIGAGMTSVVLKAQVVLTPILALWALKESMSGRFWAGGLLALLGVAWPAMAESGSTVASGAGYLWALGAALGFAGMQIYTRRVIDRIQASVVNALRLVMAVLILQLLPEGRDAWSLPPLAWAYAAGAGVLGPGLSRLCLMAAIRHVSPSVTALIALIGPIFAFALGGLVFGERPTWADLVGAGFILAGVVWSLAPSLGANRAAWVRPTKV